MRIWKQAVVSLVVLAAAVVLWARYFPQASGILQRVGIATAAIEADPGAGEGTSGFDGPGAPPVARAAPVVAATVNDRVSAIGDGLAAQSVTVTPRVDGRVASIEVASGDFVEAGAALVRLEAEAEEIALDRARLVLEDARATLARAEELRRSNAVSEVALRAAELAASQAELALRDAELALEHKLVRAPFGGWVGILGVEVGDQVSTSTPVATLDDRSTIFVDFRIPERFVGQLEAGAPVSALPLAQPGLLLSGEIATVDSRISADTRTIRVRASFDNAEDRLRPGMAFSIDMRFPGDTFVAVDPLAIQWNADGAYVWTAANGQAAQVPVRIVQRDDDAVLVDGALEPGAMVVIEGVQLLREGEPLRLEGEAPATADESGGQRRPRI
jgi:RND family efflux transporter MFP subunit